MIKVVNGDLLDATEDIIGHQVNCQGVMGSGVARLIRNKYPQVYRQYMGYCRFARAESILGHCQIWYQGNRLVANLFGQLNYGRDKSVVYTDYIALGNALVSLHRIAKSGNKSVALPYNIGCGLANGDWDGVVYPLLEEIFKDYNLTLYKLA